MDGGLDLRNRDENIQIGNTDAFINTQVSDITAEINNGVIPNITQRDDMNDIKTEEILFYNNDINAVKGIVEETPLSNLFFSKDNVDALQLGIRFGVYDKYKKVISNQSEQELVSITRGIFLDQNNTETELKPAVQTYNQQVLDAVLPRVGTQLLQYEGYIDKISKMPPPLDYPEHGRTVNYTYDISNLL